MIRVLLADDHKLVRAGVLEAFKVEWNTLSIGLE
jgi:DNA-binding NarL/FixJ family response regulator